MKEHLLMVAVLSAGSACHAEREACDRDPDPDFVISVCETIVLQCLPSHEEEPIDPYEDRDALNEAQRCAIDVLEGMGAQRSCRGECSSSEPDEYFFGHVVDTSLRYNTTIPTGDGNLVDFCAGQFYRWPACLYEE